MAQAVFELVARPEYIEPLREEVRRVRAEDGGSRLWTKASMAKLRKMDSFIKESQRFQPAGLGMMIPYLLSNSLQISVSRIVLADPWASHHAPQMCSRH